MLRFVEGVAAGKVLKSATRDVAWTMQPTRDGRYTRYGLGFGVIARNGRWMVAHSGAQQETRTDLVIAPAEHFAIALAANFEDADLGIFEDKLIELFLGDPRPVNMRGSDDATQATVRAMNEAFTNGLAYYERHRGAMTTDARALDGAFDYFRRARGSATLAADGSQPLAGEPLTKLGSYMASVLAAKGDLDVYHREGALRFFADYAAARPKRNFDDVFARRTKKWADDWKRIWTPELQSVDAASDAGLAVLERNRALLEAAAVKPDFSRPMVAYAERAGNSGEYEKALRTANLAYALYPRAANVNGFLGVLTLVMGERARAKSFLATSLAIDPNDYARAANLLNVAKLLDRGTTQPAAAALRELVAELHPRAPAK
ncbi:MAG TPA: hypothetical protein VND45_17305 [Thermoanaerobaculia bacterium]|nr:hypothetical protein [Thermoanaerobaculia bacterium]